MNKSAVCLRSTLIVAALLFLASCGGGGSDVGGCTLVCSDSERLFNASKDSCIEAGTSTSCPAYWNNGGEPTLVYNPYDTPSEPTPLEQCRTTCKDKYDIGNSERSNCLLACDSQYGEPAPAPTPLDATFVPLDTTTELPYSSTVDTSNSYFELTGLTAGTSYVATITGLSGAVDIIVYNESTIIPNKTIAACYSQEAGVADDYCSFVPTGTSAWLIVDGQNISSTVGTSTYTLDLAELVPEGTTDAPVTLAYGIDTPHSGTVDTTTSYYEITGLTAGKSTGISVIGQAAHVDYSVYDEPTFTTAACNSATNNSSLDVACSVTPTGTSLWVSVITRYAASEGTTYTLYAVQ